jgi:tripartite-type tricarboxylate transporter receptor subunit TctC
VRIVVPWPPAGAGDIAARVMAQQLAAKLPKSVIVENRPGANGIIGVDVVAKSPPDGHTLLLGSVETLTLNPHIYPKLPYDPLTDLTPIAGFAKVLYVMAGRAALPATSAKEATALVEAQPSKLSYGSWGIGSLAHVGMEMIIGQSGLKILHVPYNGGPPAYQALAAGQIDLMIMPAGLAAPLKSGGKIRILGVATGERYSLMPETLTLKEQGYDMEIVNPFGILAPAKTPPAVLRRLEAEIGDILKRPDVQSTFKAQGMETFFLSQKEYSEYLRTEFSRWGNVVRRANIKIDK